jgi:pimeloyl-ACP methyl ester carboxylesterase
VGHSAGGLSITEACHKFPDKVSLAVYVTATMLKFGYSTDEDLKDVSHFLKFCSVFISLNVLFCNYF